MSCNHWHLVPKWKTKFMLSSTVINFNLPNKESLMLEFKNNWFYNLIYYLNIRVNREMYIINNIKVNVPVLMPWGPQEMAKRRHAHKYFLWPFYRQAIIKMDSTKQFSVFSKHVVRRDWCAPKFEGQRRTFKIITGYNEIIALHCCSCFIERHCNVK